MAGGVDRLDCLLDWRTEPQDWGAPHVQNILQRLRAFGRCCAPTIPMVPKLVGGTPMYTVVSGFPDVLHVHSGRSPWSSTKYAEPWPRK